MIKVTTNYGNIKEEITIDLYIPIDIKWGDYNEIEECTRYCRFGDFKESLLEIGVGSSSGIIRSITLVEVKEVHLNKSQYDFKTIDCEQGVPILSMNGWIGSDRIDIKRNLSVFKLDNGMLLCFGDKEHVKCIQSGRVKFGLNRLNELCNIELVNLTIEEMTKLDLSLRYML